MQTQIANTRGLFVLCAKRGSSGRLKQISTWVGSGQEMKSTEVGFEGRRMDKTEERGNRCVPGLEGGGLTGSLKL